MIPSEFNILGHTIHVIVDNDYCHNNECTGRFIEWENKIIIADRYKTPKTWRKYEQSIVEHTFYHELTHCILYYAKSELWLDEKFVDTVGGLFHQFTITKK